MNRVSILLRVPRELAASLFPQFEAPVRSQPSAIQKPQSFYNLVSEVLSHHFCYILSVRSGSIGPAQTQGEGINTRAQISGGRRIKGVILEAAYHRIKKKKYPRK